jgi:hypothetical protein
VFAPYNSQTCAIVPPWCKEVSLEVHPSGTSLFSKTRTFFTRDASVAIGFAVEILVKMTQKITGNWQPPELAGASRRASELGG